MRNWRIVLTVGVALTMATLVICRNVTSPPSYAAQAPEGNAAAVALIAREGDPAPADVGGVISRIVSSSISDSGAVVYCAALSGSSAPSAVFRQDASGTRTLLRSGDASPDGRRFEAFEEVDVTELAPTGKHAAEDVMLFRATLEGSSTSEGVYFSRGGQIESVALSGGQTPRGRVWRSFSWISLTCISVATTSDADALYAIAYVGQTADDHKSLVLSPSYTKTPGEVLSTGDSHKKPGLIVEDFTPGATGLSVGCVLLLHNEVADRRFHKVVVVDLGLTTTGNALRDGSRFPSLGRVIEIQEPPATQMQAALVSVRFGSGVEALVLRDPIGDATVLAKSGDTAPGVVGEQTMIAFGPPVTTRFPTGSMTIVSNVSLSDGVSALFLQRFSGQAPPIETGRVVTLIDGAALIDGAPVSLTSVVPLKLTRDNRVLLQARLDDAMGIVVLSSPFE